MLHRLCLAGMMNIHYYKESHILHTYSETARQVQALCALEKNSLCVIQGISADILAALIFPKPFLD